MTTTTSGSTDYSSTFDTQTFSTHYIGSAYRDFADSSDKEGFQLLEARLIVPEDDNDESPVGLELEWQLHVDKALEIEKGAYLFNWVTLSTTSTEWTTQWLPDSTGIDVETEVEAEVEKNYSLACVIEAETGDTAMVMNFEGPGSLEWEGDS